MKYKMFLLALLSLPLLAACNQTILPNSGGYGQSNGVNTPLPPVPPASQSQQMQQTAQSLTIGALLPLQNTQIGQPMLNAMQMALDDMRAGTIRLVIKDSGTSPTTANRAASEAKAEGASLLFGPIYADQVRAVKQTARGTPIIAFSTDTSVAGQGTYLLSVLPEQQVARILTYARGQGRTAIAVITTPDAYGDLVARSATATLGTAPPILRVTAANITTAPLTLPPRTDAVLLALSPALANTVAGRLAGQKLAFYGLGLWDDPALAKATALNNAEFAAPDPAQRVRFEKNYQSLFGTIPPRLATQAYDATALAAVLAMQGDGVSAATMQNRAGFNGVDGLFRLNPTGLPERGLAVLRVRNGQIEVVSPAPTRFAL